MRPGRALLAGITLALAVLLALGVPQVSQARWSTGTATSGSVTAGTADLDVSGTAGLAYEFKAGNLAVATTVTIENTGSLPLSGLTARTTATGAAAAAVNVAVWPLTGGCTSTSQPPSGAVTGTWASLPNWAPSTLAAHTSATYCVLAAMTAGDVTANRNTAVTATLSVTGADGSWTAVATAPAFTESITAPAPEITPAEAGISGPTYDISIPSVTISPMASDGTVGGSGTYCLHVTVEPSFWGVANGWSFKIATAQAPYNSAPRGNWSVTSGNATISSFSAGSLTIRGTGWIYAPTVVDICVVASSANQTLTAEGANTYRVGTSTLASCDDRGLAATATNACIWTDVTGLSPHFYVGFQYSFNVQSIVDATTSLPASVRTPLRSKSVRGVSATTGVSEVTTGTAGLTLSGTRPSYTVASRGLGADDGGLVAGMTKTFKARLS